MERPAREYLAARHPALRERLDAHRSHHVTPEDLLWADEVLVMNPTHAQRVDEMCPEPRRITHLGSYAGADRILDPHMRRREEQLAILDLLCTAVEVYAGSRK